MKVFMVAGSFSYEGDQIEMSGAVFRNYEDARKYGESLLDVFDAYTLKEVVLG